MTRIYRVALAAVAAAMLTTAVAAPAQATPKFEAGGYPAKVEGSGNLVFGMEIGNLVCPFDFEGSMSGSSSSVTLTPFVEYFNCDAWGLGLAVTVMNSGCDTALDATEKLAADLYAGEFDLCPTGSLTLATTVCQVKFEGQKDLSAVEFDVDTGSPDRVEASFDISELEYDVIKDGVLCPFKGTGVRTDGTLDAEPFVLKAVNPSKTTEELGLLVSGE